MARLSAPQCAAAAVLFTSFVPFTLHAAGAAPPDDPALATPPSPTTTVVPPAAAASASKAGAPSTQLETVKIRGTRERLDAARNGLSPDTGSTIYRFDSADIAALPLGASTPLNQVILQAPGVVQDSYGQLHVRGDHGNVQYRLNGVIIPESISGFGQSLETRFADNINVLTGALPAQYGYRTAAVVDIRTKGDAIGNGGSVGVLFGSHGYGETNADVHGTQGDLSYYVTGSFVRNNSGIENPTGGSSAIHDETRQGKGFGYLSYVLDPTSRVSLLLGTSNNRFQIPNVPGQTPNFMLASAPTIDSAALDARQRERNSFGVGTYQGSAGDDIDYQVSFFHRTTDLHYTPDAVGDLVFGGIAADITRRNIADGLQADASWHLGATHTVRVGLFGQREKFDVANAASVFPADADGNQTGNVPINVTDGSHLDGHLWGVYLQDEWQATRGLTVNYGLRYDQVKTVVDENQLSPRIGAVYELNPQLRLHVGYARYFTPPPTEKIDTTSVAKFANTTNALPSDANTAVKSERSNYYDVGAAYQLTPAVTLGIDGYYRSVQHLQDEGQFGNALIYSAFNFNQGRIGGLEISASYHEKALSSYVNLGFSRARGKGVETGQFNFDDAELATINSNWVHLDHEQRLTAAAGTSYRWADGTVLGVDALYGSGLRNGFANTEHLPSYVQLNASASRGFDLGRTFGKFETRVSMLNVFDRSYELRDGSGIGVGAPQFGPRRTLFIGVTKLF